MAEKVDEELRYADESERNIHFLSARQVFITVTTLGFCMIGLAIFLNGERTPKSQKVASEEVEAVEKIPSGVSERVEISIELQTSDTGDLNFEKALIHIDETNSENLFIEFVGMVDSFSFDFKSDLNDYIFDSDAIEYYEENFAEIFRSKPLARNAIIEGSSFMTLDRLWGEALSKTELTASKREDIRSTIQRLYVQNAEYSDLRDAGEITMQEWLDRFASEKDVLQAVSALIPEDKFQELEGHFEEKMSKREPNLLREAMIRDSFTFSAFDAIHSEDPVLLESLLAAGADINAVSEFTPAKSLFERVVDSEIPEMIEVMLAYGADIDSKDVYGNSMLHRAVRAGNPDIVNQLLESGANPLSRDLNGLTPAMRARLYRLEHGEDKYNALHTLLKNAEANVSQ